MTRALLQKLQLVAAAEPEASRQLKKLSQRRALGQEPKYTFVQLVERFAVEVCSAAAAGSGVSATLKATRTTSEPPPTGARRPCKLCGATDHDHQTKKPDGWQQRQSYGVLDICGHSPILHQRSTRST